MEEETAYFALACFWKPDAQFGSKYGIVRTRVGYCGGNGPAPNYPSVNDHTEVVEVVYDPDVLSYEDLLLFFWEFHDPCSCKKRQYMSAIFYVTQLQKTLAEKNKKLREHELEKEVATQILPLNVFHVGEKYHQKYFLRTYHRTFYENLPEEDPVLSTRDARLNGYLSGYGKVEDLTRDACLLGLAGEQLQYVEQHMTGDKKAGRVEPLLRTVVQVAWNYVMKATGN